MNTEMDLCSQEWFVYLLGCFVHFFSSFVYFPDYFVYFSHGFVYFLSHFVHLDNFCKKNRQLRITKMPLYKYFLKKLISFQTNGRLHRQGQVRCSRGRSIFHQVLQCKYQRPDAPFLQPPRLQVPQSNT